MGRVSGVRIGKQEGRSTCYGPSDDSPCRWTTPDGCSSTSSARRRSCRRDGSSRSRSSSTMGWSGERGPRISDPAYVRPSGPNPHPHPHPPRTPPLPTFHRGVGVSSQRPTPQSTGHTTKTCENGVEVKSPETKRVSFYLRQELEGLSLNGVLRRYTPQFS